MNTDKNTDRSRAPRALIAMSGGVDSSTAAFLMKDAGYDCIGVTMRLFDNAEAGIRTEKACCSLDDVADARFVAARLGMPYYVFDFQDDFRSAVMDRFVHSYETGCTPNPCIACNRYLKFERLFRRATELGCDYVVTGHYARVERDEKTGRFLLKKAVDANKDQSYVLYSLTQEQLAHVQFPLGGMTKPDVRDLAEAQHFVNARKHDSQDICFVPDGRYADFIERYTGKQYPEGNFTDRDGHVIGRHKGIIHYTIGQRKGLGLSLPEPMFVCRVNPEDNTVVLGKNEDLYSRELLAKDVNLITTDHIDGTMRLTAKVRYRQPDRPATVTQSADGTLRVVFDEPQRAITRGQAVVLYDGDTVVGGGTITDVPFPPAGASPRPAAAAPAAAPAPGAFAASSAAPAPAARASSAPRAAAPASAAPAASPDPAAASAALRQKRTALEDGLRRLGRAAVAYSAGVDSTFLLKTAVDTLGPDNVLALTAVSGVLPAHDRRAAAAFCKENGIRHMEVPFSVFQVEHFAENPANRCYYCKLALMRQMQSAARENGFTLLCDGSNFDDTQDYRPGAAALRECGVDSPLQAAGLTKADIRTLSRELGLPTWNKPSAACLASRIPYGHQIAPEQLRVIEQAEGFLTARGYTDVRVRLHENVARIEVSPSQIARMAQPAEAALVSARLHAMGFAYVTLDLTGYRTGSLNETVPGARAEERNAK